MESLERTWFTVNDDHTVTVLGWLEERDNNWEGFFDDPYPRHTLITGEWPDLVAPPLRDGESVADWACPYQQYCEDFHYEDALRLVANFHDGEPGKHFPLGDVDNSTPAGNYWCLFEEE